MRNLYRHFVFPKMLQSFLALLLSLLTFNGYGHSVGQVQTTKFLAPATVKLLKTRIGTGTVGFQVGDVVTYVIQFTPIANGALVGAGGYITDYIPPGMQVVGASFVQPNSASPSGYVSVEPSLPGPTRNGWAGGQNTYAAPFDVPSYDPTGLCVFYGRTNNCNGSEAQVYADTGIFFSTDARTAVFPSVPSRIEQGTNGYFINPTAVGQLDNLVGNPSNVATTHNLWDAQQTNAFGTTSLPASTPNANASQGMISSSGRRLPPFGTGSTVAGPQTGYPLDATGGIGPWQRIYYPGSRIGSLDNGPAFDADSTYDNTALSETSTVRGAPTSLGRFLSLSNPLPSNTNAVRWAAGALVVGQNKYVMISLKVATALGTGGIINGSEVFGGDSAQAAGENSNDSAWRYHVPSVADNNSNLFIEKIVVCVYSGANCLPSDGSVVPSGAKIRYRITYLNAGNLLQTNVVVTDTLPAETAAGGVSNFSLAASPPYPPSAPGPVAPGTPNILPATLPGTLANGVMRFVAIPTLDPGVGGLVEFDLQTNSAAAGTVIQNKAKMTSTQVSAGATASANSTVSNTANLQLSKTTSTPSVAANGAATYTITVTNTGTAATSGSIVVTDFLPFNGTTADASRRFNFVGGSSIFTGAITGVTPAVAVPPTIAPYTGNTNQQQVEWNFGSQTLAAGASFTITFNATAGANMPALPAGYTNDVQVSYTAGNLPLATSATGQAPVTVLTPLTIKNPSIVYTTQRLLRVMPMRARARYRSTPKYVTG